MAAKKFTLIFVLLFSLAAWGQQDPTKTKGAPADGQQGGPGYVDTSVSCENNMCVFKAVPGNVAPADIPTAPDPGSGTAVPSSGGPNLSGNIDSTQGGQAGYFSSDTSGPQFKIGSDYSAVGFGVQHDSSGWDFGHGEQGSDATRGLLNANKAWEQYGGLVLMVAGDMEVPALNLGRFPAGFGDNDLSMGINEEDPATGRLSLLEFKFRVGGNGGKLAGGWRPFSKLSLIEQIQGDMNTAVDSGGIIRFDITNYNPNFKFPANDYRSMFKLEPITKQELNYLQENWGGRFNNSNVVFYRNGIPGQLPPWMK